MTKALRRLLICAMFLALGVGPALADEIVLKDGTKIVGSIVSEEGSWTIVQTTSGVRRRIRTSSIQEVRSVPPGEGGGPDVSGGRPYPLPAGGIGDPEILYNRADRSVETPARAAEDKWRRITGHVLSQVHTQDKAPRTAVIRKAETLARFLGDEERAESLTRRVYRGTPEHTNEGHVDAPTVQLGPGPRGEMGSMLVGVHLGRLGSKGFDVEIFRIERARRVGKPPLVTVKYRVTGSGSGGVELDAPSRTAMDFGGGEQTSAPASAVKIPFLGLDEELKFIPYVGGQEGWFPSGLGALGLMVTGDPTIELPPMRVNRLGRIQGESEGQDARALVSEMMRLRKAIQEARPRSLSSVERARPSEEDVLRRSARFNLRLWGTTGSGSQDVEGAWSGVEERLEPVRQALELILLRLRGVLDPEDLERLAGRLPFDSISLQVDPLFEGDSALKVRITQYGLVQAGGRKGTLTEPEIDHLAMVFERVDLEALPEYFDRPEGFQALNIPGARGTTFRLTIRKDGSTKDVGGFLEAGGPTVAVIKQALELVAARVEGRPAEVGGVVQSDGSGSSLRIKHHYVTFEVDPIAGDAQAVAWTRKITEWAGRWVEIKAVARLTTRESGRISPRTVLYPQQAVIQGIVRGNTLEYMEAGQAEDEVQLGIDLFGRANALVGDQNGRWVTLKTFLFYDESFYPSEAFVEAVQVVISDRPEFRLFKPIRGERNDFLIHLHQGPTRGSPTTNALRVTRGLQHTWVTNRKNGFSFIPTPPNGGRGGWAEEVDREFHIGEDPDDVDDDIRRGTMDIIRDVAADVLSEGLGGGGGD